MSDSLWPADVTASDGQQPDEKEISEFTQHRVDAGGTVPGEVRIHEPAETYPVVTFKVPGIARPQGSKRAVGGTKGGKAILIESSKHVGNWRTDVKQYAAAVMESYPPLDEPLQIEVVFVFAQPKSHLLKNGSRRSGAPAQPTGRNLGDLSKLLRAIEDAMTGTVYRDDALISSAVMKKRWGLIPCTYITVRPDPGLP